MILLRDYMNNFFRWGLTALSFSCLSSFSYANSDSLKVLFIGNSYTHMNNMPKIFDKLCQSKGKRVIVEMNTRAGASFKVHTGRQDMFDKIKSRKWDYVILQGYSREFIEEPAHIDTSSVPYMVQIMDSIRANHACTQILLYQTWGYKDGYLENTLTDNYEKMTDKIQFGYRYISEVFSLPISPVGSVWKELRKNVPDINLYDTDNAHPNKNGSYLSACTFYTAIFRESPEGAVTGTIGSREAKEIQKQAATYVLPRLSELKLDINYFSVNAPKPIDRKYLVFCKSNYINATSVVWEFGDGSKSTEKSVTYLYKKPGTYRVKLTIVQPCGTVVHRTKIHFEAPKKPKKQKESKPATQQKTNKKI
jgi:hypothetical protein